MIGCRGLSIDERCVSRITQVWYGFGQIHAYERDCAGRESVYGESVSAVIKYLRHRVREWQKRRGQSLLDEDSKWPSWARGRSAGSSDCPLARPAGLVQTFVLDGSNLAYTGYVPSQGWSWFCKNNVWTCM